MARPLLKPVISLAVLLGSAGCGEVVAQSDRAYPAVLAGHAVLPALTLLDPPSDAPEELRTSGKSAPSATVGDVTPPFAGQPAQGHSAIRRMPDGTFWLLSDNGAGSKSNSPDFMLHLSRYRVDFDSGEFKRLQTVFLSDPDNRAPFPITTEGSTARYLSGSDLDPESLQFAGGQMWIGDEFGPFLVKFDPAGGLRAVFEALVDGRVARSPDHPGGAGSAEVARSKGFEAMAVSPDGRMLYPMLEGPLTGGADPKEVRILEFDVDAERWTGRHWLYPLTDESHAVGDMAMLDETTALVIERDDGYGTVDRACPGGEARDDCFSQPARFKRVYKIEMGEQRVGAPVRKIAYVDLMAISDPRGVARTSLTEGLLTFPFRTVESIDVVDDRHIVVGNDNNLPYSRSREPDRLDDNELVLLEVAEFLRAR